MIKFWFKFNFDNASFVPYGTRIGCGVTALSYIDAVSLMNERVFYGHQIAEIDVCIQNVDVSTLDPGHVLPNMLSPNKRGIWFPLGFD